MKILIPALSLPLLLASAPASAQDISDCSAIASATFSGTCTAAANAYVFTIKSFRLRRDDGTFVTIGSGNQTFDAASVSAGAAMGAYVSGAPVPSGTYDALSPILDATWSVRAATEGGAADSCATSGSDPSGVVTGTGASTLSVDLAAFFDAHPEFLSENMFVSGGDIVIVDTDIPDLPVTIGDGESLAIDIVFHAGEGAMFTYASGNCDSATLGPIGVEISLTVS